MFTEPYRSSTVAQLLIRLIFSTTIMTLTVVHSKKFVVLRIDVEDKAQLDFLQNLYLNTSKYDFWKEPTKKGEDVHVMVSEDNLAEFEDQLKLRNFPSWKLMIKDVGELIQQRLRDSEQRKLRSTLLVKRQHDAVGSVGNRATFGFNRYHTFATMINYLNSLAVKYPDRCQVQPIGISHEGRQIPLIKIGTNKGGIKKPAIWVDGGIHAREWVSPAVVLYFIERLITSYDSDPQIRQFVDQIDWYIVPLLNPDGYEFSRSSSEPEVRLWRKNRSPPQCSQISTGPFTPPHTQCCQGVDLNRNFDWYFGQVGASNDPCSEIYSGTSAFSEPETRSIRDFIGQQKGRIKTFLTFHSYSQILMYPFGHALRTYPQDVDELSSTALRAAQALQSMFGTKYAVGTGADTLYPASGGSEDWAKGRMGVKYSFLFELRPEDNVYDGFLLPENQILPAARETWEAVKIISDQTLRQFGTSNFSPSSNSILSPHTISSFTIDRGRRCRDLDQLCGYWAQNGACHTWPGMRERCSYSCGFCDPVNKQDDQL